MTEHSDRKQMEVREGEVLPSSGKVLMSLAQAREVARIMWEVQGLTMPEIASLMGKSLGAIEKWGRVMHWQTKKEIKARRAGGVDEVREMTRQKFLDILADKGMPTEKAMSQLIDGMSNPLLPAEELTEEDSEGNLVKRTVQNVDYKTRHKFLHDYMLIAGAIGNNDKASQGGGAGGTVNIQVIIPEKRGGGE